MNGFKKKKVRGLTLGEKMQELRNERRISLNEISKNTQIPIKYLINLEKGDYEKLPADVYIKGFLRSCAEYLNVNPNILLKYYEREKGIQSNIKKTSSSFQKKIINLPKIDFFTFKFKYFIILVLLVILSSGGFFIYTELNKFISAPRLVVLIPQNGETVQKTELVLKGVTEENAKVKINQQPILVKDQGHFEEKIIIKKGENKIIIQAENRFHKKTEKQIIVYGKF